MSKMTKIGEVVAPSYEDLRKKARQLENEIDIKLVSFSKLGYANSVVQNNERQQLLSPNDHVIDTMGLEIDSLLSRLTEINDKMGDCVSVANGGGSAFLHTMQRHRDILQDSSHEYSKIKTNINNSREREELLGNRDEIESKDWMGGRVNLYLKEHQHIKNSDRLTDQAIEVAIATRESLHSQHQSLGGITNKLHFLSSKFPAINNVVQKINFRKKRDSIILASVLGVCIVFLLWYSLG